MKKEIVIGFAILIAALIFFYGFNFLKGKNLFSNAKSYYAVYQRVDGLLPSSAVQLNGFNVGKVESIYFHPDESGRLIVKFNITEPELKIPNKSQVQVASFDLLGTKGLKLLINPSSELYQEGDTLNSGFETSIRDEVNQQVLPLKNKVESLISQFDSALKIVQGVFTEDFQESITSKFGNTMSSLEHIAHTSDKLISDNSGSIKNIMTNLEASTKTLKDNNQNLTKIIDNTAQITDSLAAIDIAYTFKKVDKAMSDVSSILEKVENGEGSLGKLLKDESVYNNLDQATLELDKLLEDMRVNPKRYVHLSVFGRKDKDKPEKKPRNE